MDARRLAVVTAVLAVAAAAALLVGGTLATMIERTFARDCPPDAPATMCVATLPAEITGTWDDHSESEPYERQLSLAIPAVSEDTVTAWLTMPDADRLNAEADTEVTVVLYDGEVQEVSARNGETAATTQALRPPLAALELVGWLLPMALGLIFLRVPWLRRAGAASAAGAVAVPVATLITAPFVTATWAVPIMAAAYLVTAAAVVSRERSRFVTAGARAGRTPRPTLP